MFQRKGRLFAAALCAMMAATLIVPAAAHGHRGGHHSGYCQSVYSQPAYTQPAYTQPEDTQYTPPAAAVCPACPYEDCLAAGQHHHNGTAYCGYNHAGGYCDGTCAVTPYYYGYSYGGCSHGYGYGHHGCW